MLLAASFAAIAVAVAQTFVLARMISGAKARAGVVAALVGLVLAATVWRARPEEGLAICAELAALHLLVRDAKGEGPLRPVLLGALLSVACAAEPTNLVALVVVGVHLYTSRPGTVGRYALTALSSIGLFVAWSERRFHLPLPPRLSIDLAPASLVWSYAPIAACALAFVLVRGARPVDRLVRLAIAAILSMLWFSSVSPYGAHAAFAALPFVAVALVALVGGRVSRAKAVAAAALALALGLHGKSALARKPREKPATPVATPATPGRIALAEPSSDALVVSGWSAPEGYFRWTEGTRARIRLPAMELPPGAGVLVVGVQLTPFLVEGHRHEQRVEVSFAGRALATWNVKRPQPSLYVARIPREVLAGTSPEERVLTFDLPDAVSAATLGTGPDARVLGIAVHFIELQPEREP